MPRAAAQQTQDFAESIAAYYAPVPKADRTEADKIAACLAWGIIHQRYRAGERLREQELAGEYGVSRTVIRDVLSKLSLRGLVEIHARRGANIVKFTRDELADLLELNARLRSFATNYAAMRADKEDVRELRDILEHMRQLQHAGEAPEHDFLDLRIAFGERLDRATGPLNAVHMRANAPLFVEHQYILATVHTRAQRAKDLDYLTKMVDLIEAGEASKAEKLVLRYLRAQTEVILDAHF